ncbi:phage repressor protein/antirepressor Ant [Bacillus sp. WMMC1349]|uniref:phage antirepressor KilAC domain-containing protein n=1 Tax=Bacillus sp. WMMC1349 TaxID=2736254 RepID=UPI001553400C|nr:phage antirepressor KilAC domain-containing protein [Bacillus sp. WMMC1349]NPC90987.1 phage repressor protein/antirepressor Ant [Bacillus sp. WMMC1349]NPC94971.1 phage repressor protein/antirepressor Ant [Bacillus sp. WMMC1349]NPC95041.1 phage repressor protein/antirepressor Ant [Bacillus sp. WMMC1349]NPC95075.1 phage repressor protein/antirepressor Ant [Bacillus sp. WMMC1349]NPC95109.1 phage repressor protein/antirepressor Ant [Bacillus sp. WMMC1349]
MNELQTFNHKIFGDLPVMIVDGVEWFGAKEIAKALSFSKPHNAIQNHVEEDDSAVHGVIDRIGRKQKKKFVNESGLYDLIFGAAKQGNNREIKEKAKKFKRWVTSEVLPIIRKTGGYVNKGNEEQFIKNYFPSFSDEVKQAMVLDLRNQNNQLKKQIEQNKPKVLFADSVSASSTSILVGELAKLLKQNGIETGQKRFFAWLRDNGYLIKRKGTDYNMPTQKSMESGLFEIKETSITHSDGHISISKTPKVTGKGQVYFINKFLTKEEAVS